MNNDVFRIWKNIEPLSIRSNDRLSLVSSQTYCTVLGSILERHANPELLHVGTKSNFIAKFDTQIYTAKSRAQPVTGACGQTETNIPSINSRNADLPGPSNTSSLAKVNARPFRNAEARVYSSIRNFPS
jgi:hypothetical protein